MEVAIDIAKQLGPIAVLAVLIAWQIGKAVNKIVDRFLAGMDKIAERVESLGERVHRMGARIQQHSEADAEVVAAVARLEGKMDQALMERHIEPHDETPPLGSPRRDTPRPGAYGIVRRTRPDDSDDSGG